MVKLVDKNKRCFLCACLQPKYGQLRPVLFGFFLPSEILKVIDYVVYRLALLNISPKHLVRPSLLTKEAPVVVYSPRHREQELEVTLAVEFFFKIGQHLHVLFPKL